MKFENYDWPEIVPAFKYAGNNSQKNELFSLHRDLQRLPQKIRIGVAIEKRFNFQF